MQLSHELPMAMSTCPYAIIWQNPLTLVGPGNLESMQELREILSLFGVPDDTQEKQEN